MRSGAAFAMALTWMTLLFVLFVVDASPVSRRLETTTSALPDVVTSDWDEVDDFDLDEGEDDWLGDAVPVSPSSLPFRSDFDDDDYEDDDESTSSNKRPSDDDDVEVQDGEELDEESEKADDGGSRRSSAEFLFMPASDNRLMLQDDDGDQSGLIKVRHTGKSQYPEIQSNSLEEEDNDVDNDEVPSKDDGQFEFTIGQDGDTEDKSKDDFVLEDTRSSKDESDDENIPKPATRNIEDLDDDDDDEDDDLVFESPEEDSQVIYGDPVFLY